MSRKVSAEPVKRLTVELPESEYQVLEDYCRSRQESKRQVIRSFIRRLRQREGVRNRESGVNG
ncbi:hypothetical protein K9N68_05945 [Kovacikia minuta CCNUW1]|uniref:hypothetical protein n=1 Tax=Kovacikia minuta TaxID=2931930 RepID=UPI001CCBFD21|nr:hypothetical protein [Kovacikia minuta]UBF27485.1 hypothetical protein K9N68_05945 [Kovacikia minuta CCNUW1]